jgi:hypothetical protein
MPTTPRPLKAAGTTQYQTEVAAGVLDIIDGEIDADLDTLYNLVNGNLDNANIATNASIAYSKLALGGSIKGSDLAPGAVGTTLLADNSVTSAKIADGTIVPADLAPGASIRAVNVQNVPTGWSTTLLNQWQPIVAFENISIGSPYVRIEFAVSGLFYAGAGGNVWFRLMRDPYGPSSVNIWQMLLKFVASGPTPPWVFTDWSAPIGTHTYEIDVQVSAGAWATDAAANNNGHAVLWNLT